MGETIERETQKTLVIVTRAFPYYPGEQFLEDEAPYWCGSDFTSVVILPAQAIGDPRTILPALTVNPILAQQTKSTFVASLLSASISPFFFKELLYLLRLRRTTFSNVMRALSVTARALRTARGLAKYAKTHGTIHILYSYWNDGLAYGACLAKRRGHVRHVVSRAHGGDLYEERYRGYLPLKRQFILDFNAIATLSISASKYLERHFGALPRQVSVWPLGVPVPKTLSSPSPAGMLHVVSVSYCVPVKRIDKIIDAVADFATKGHNLHISWTHIGDGPLKGELVAIAEIILGAHRNCQFTFLGQIPNEKVKQFYVEHPVDLILNTSDSEGMPVSIMEAMACGVPAIAPATGGVDQLVDVTTGILINPMPEVQEISAAIQRFVEDSDISERRSRARARVEERFNADKNYPDFLEWLSDYREASS